jgi:EmrB/QacA subfamily drug resistance transporter
MGRGRDVGDETGNRVSAGGRAEGEPRIAAASERFIGSERNRWLILTFVGIGTFMGALDTFVVNVAIPSLRTDLGASPSEAELVVTSYALTYAVLLITGGRLGDLFGRVRVYLIGMVVFTAASALCAVAPNPAFLIGARVVQAAGAAVMVPQAYAVVQRIFNPLERVRAISYLSVSSSGAVIFGQVIGGLLIQANVAGLEWRSVFAINIPIGVIGVIGGLIVLPRVRPERTAGLDLPGVALLTLALLLLIVPLVEGSELGWPLWVIVLLALSPVAFLGFAKHQMLRAAQGRFPLIDPSLFRQRSFSVGLPIVLFTQIGLNGMFFVFAIYLQSGRHLSPGSAGLAFASIGIGYSSTALFSPRLAVRFGRGIIAVGFLVVGAGGLAAILTLQAIGSTGSPFYLMPAVALMGAGQGFINSPLFATVLSQVRRGHEGSASGTLTTAVQVGSAVGVAITGLIFFSVLGDAASAVAYTQAFAASLIVVVVVNFLFTGFVRLLPPRQPSSPADGPVTDDVATGVSDAMQASNAAVAGEG